MNLLSFLSPFLSSAKPHSTGVRLECDLPALFGLGTMMWVGIGTAVVGAASSVYSADKNRKLQHQAQDANKEATQASDQTNYQRWLLSRGVGADGTPVNTKMPLWMTSSSFGANPKTSRFRRVGTGPSLAAATNFNGATDTAATNSPQLVPAGQRTSGGGGGGNGLLNTAVALDPVLGPISRLFG